LYSYAARILSLADHKDFTVFTTPECLAIVWYFAEKKSGSNKARYKIEILTQHIKVANSGSLEVEKALANKSIHEFEDGIQYYSAMHAGCDVVVTENKEDFYFSEIPVYSAEELILNIAKH